MKKYLLIIFILFVGNISFSQNIFDEENSAKYALYLFSEEEYSLSAEEYERLIFMSAENYFYAEKLIISYRKSNQLEKAKQVANKFYTKGENLYWFYIQTLILSKDFNKAKEILSAKAQNEKVKIYLSGICFLEEDYKKAEKELSEIKISSQIKLNLEEIYKEHSQAHYKKKYLAGTMSAIIPGSGKIYSGDKINGLISLMMIGLNSWQSYRAYNKHGVRSAYTWFFGGLASGFYLGNIYGSYKSAKRHNQMLDEHFEHEVIDVLCE